MLSRDPIDLCAGDRETRDNLADLRLAQIVFGLRRVLSVIHSLSAGCLAVFSGEKLFVRAVCHAAVVEPV